MNPIRAAILGYGVIGKRLADAVRAQSDMKLIGVAGRPSSFSLRDAQLLGYPVYVTEEPRAGDAASRFCQIRGTLGDLLPQIDVLLDCTPSGVPARYLENLARHPNLVTIVQGGEKAGSADVSFNAFTNYPSVVGKKRVRVISCSSTGTTRILFTLARSFGLRRAFVSLLRRAADPGKPSKNPINALTPVMGQSHHAPDVSTVMPGLKAYSMSADCPTTLSHVLQFQADLDRVVSAGEILSMFEAMPRIVVGQGLRSTADVANFYREQHRWRQDRPEVYVWREGVTLHGATVYLTASVHMESITIPETIDCIRAALGREPNAWTSIERTDQSLGIAKSPACYRR